MKKSYKRATYLLAHCFGGLFPQLTVPLLVLGELFLSFFKFIFIILNYVHVSVCVHTCSSVIVCMYPSVGVHVSVCGCVHVSVCVCVHVSDCL